MDVVGLTLAEGTAILENTHEPGKNEKSLLHRPMDTRLPSRQAPRLALTHFVILMIIVIAIQGTYLGYVVGILSALERRFGLSSELSGLLLSLYDIGHTIAILAVGYFGSTGHLPRITGIGVILSAIAMFLLALPVWIYGPINHDAEVFMKHKEEYANDFKCDSWRSTSEEEDCRKERNEHMVAYTFLALGQIVAGVCAAPFNTVAYVYIDANVVDKRQSPFYLGLLTSTYAFGPALGFAFAAGTNRIYTSLGGAPPHVTPRDDHWVGAWWLGFLVCGILYLLCAAPFFFFPKSYRKYVDAALLPPSPEPEEPKSCAHFMESLKAFPLILWDLLRNPVFVSMVSAWVFGSYLVGGYQTYLPKYIETQFGRSASVADVYAGFISIGAVAASTALGGWILSRWNVSPRRAILLLLGSWALIFCTYLVGMLWGCEQPEILGLQKEVGSERWSSRDSYDLGCSSNCRCSNVFHFEPVNFDGENYFSPCHAGCTDYNPTADIWSSCECAGGYSVEKGLLHNSCAAMFGYIPTMFIGLFVGNLFFMVTMLIVLRSVYDDQKVMALSLASMATNLFGFIPAPIIFGWVIDSSCVLWNSRCKYDQGNCVVYDNSHLRVAFHSTNAGFQAVAVILVAICYFISRKVKLPEEEDYEEEMPIELQPLKPPPHHDYFEGHGVHTLDHDLHHPKTSTPLKPHDYVNLSGGPYGERSVDVNTSSSRSPVPREYVNVHSPADNPEPSARRQLDYARIRHDSPPRERPPPPTPTRTPKVTDL